MLVDAESVTLDDEDELSMFNRSKISDVGNPVSERGDEDDNCVSSPSIGGVIVVVVLVVVVVLLLALVTPVFFLRTAEDNFDLAFDRGVSGD